MNIHGSCLSFPVVADQRGTMAVVSNPADIVAQQILSLIETRQGERVMLCDYGLPDYVFAVRGAAFENTLAYFLRQQVMNYVPGVETINTRTAFASGEHEAHIRVEWTLRGSNVPYNLVFPTRRLRGEPV